MEEDKGSARWKQGELRKQQQLYETRKRFERYSAKKLQQPSRVQSQERRIWPVWLLIALLLLAWAVWETWRR